MEYIYEIDLLWNNQIKKSIKSVPRLRNRVWPTFKLRYFLFFFNVLGTAPGIKLGLRQWECQILSSGLPGNSLSWNIFENERWHYFSTASWGILIYNKLCTFKFTVCDPFSSTYTKIGTIQRGLAWACAGTTQICGALHILKIIK